jgi:transcription antitermination factor NusA-like protein
VAAADVLIRAGMKRIDILRWDDDPGHFILIDRQALQQARSSDAAAP